MADSTKRVLVTGANKGIGLAIVREALDRDLGVTVLLGSRDPERGGQARESLAAEKPEWGERVDVVELDVTDDGSVTRAAAQVRERFGSEGPLYGLVNNAGIADGDLRSILDVNVVGIWRVTDAFVPLLQDGGRVVNVTSAAGPSFVQQCSAERQRFLTDPDVTWDALRAFMDECLEIDAGGGSFADAGLGGGRAYGLSKAVANSLTLLLAREHPRLRVNACTPGFIETDLTRSMADAQGKTPEEMGMKPPEAGARAPVALLFDDLEGNGRYYGSDAQRSPLDRYRSPGSPPYTGD